MKKFLTMLVLTGVLAGSVERATAHEEGWSTAGKILTGVVAAHALSHVLAPPPHVVYAPPPVYVNPAPVVYAAPPAPVYVPVIPVFRPVPVCAPPVHFHRPPLVNVQIGLGHSHHGSHGIRHYPYRPSHGHHRGHH